MQVKEVTAEELEVVLAEREKPTIIDFYADWCGPCVLLATELKQVCCPYLALSPRLLLSSPFSHLHTSAHTCSHADPHLVSCSNFMFISPGQASRDAVSPTCRSTGPV